MAVSYEQPGPSPQEVQNSRGPLVLEFGTEWCGHCRAASVLLEGTAERYSDIPVRRIEDGPGRKLGRYFKVKLWPTFIFLRDGVEKGRVVRPVTEQELFSEFERIK